MLEKYHPEIMLMPREQIFVLVEHQNYTIEKVRLHVRVADLALYKKCCYGTSLKSSSFRLLNLLCFAYSSKISR
jgi:hypothetical protein